jgi:hypothetical protein
VKPWRAAFSDAELARIDAAPPDSLVARLARLLDSYSPAIPSREELSRLDRQQQPGRVRRMDEA